MADSKLETNRPPKQVRLMVLSTPRATSVIFTKSLSRVTPSEIFIESYYFCHEAEQHLKDLGKLDDARAGRLPREEWRKVAELIAGEDCSSDTVDLDLLSFPNLKQALETPREGKRLVLCKTVSVGLEGNYSYLPDKLKNYRYTILIRHPIKVFRSFRKVMFDLAASLWVNEVGSSKALEEFNFITDSPQKYITPGLLFKELYDLWVYVRENLDPKPIIIDSDDLLSDPPGMLSKYCEILGIPYSEDLLRWEADPSATDDWRLPFQPLRHFKLINIPCHNALYSTELNPPGDLPSLDDVTDDVRESYDKVKQYYDEMYAARIQLSN